MMMISRFFLLAFAYSQWLLVFTVATEVAPMSSSVSAAADPAIPKAQLLSLDDHHPVVSSSYYHGEEEERHSVFEVPNISQLKAALYNHLVATTATATTAALSHHDDDGRRLSSNFAALNQLLSQITLQLPDATVNSNGLEISISQLTCRNLSINNLQINHKIMSSTNQRVGIQISGVQITCEFRWGYRWTIFNGAGDGSAILDPVSGASISMDFISKDYSRSPPYDVNLGNCGSNIQIKDMTFDGDGKKRYYLCLLLMIVCC
jgi:hypothetical protein